MRHVAAAVVLVVVALSASDASAVNQIIKLTRSGSNTASLFTIKADGVAMGNYWLNQYNQDAGFQGNLDLHFGVGEVSMFFEDNSNLRLTFYGPTWGNRFIEIEAAVIAYDAVAVTYLRSGHADGDPFPTSDVVTALTALSAATTAQHEDAERQTFLLQSLAQTMGLICGGLLWRTIVVAARLK